MIRKSFVFMFLLACSVHAGMFGDLANSLMGSSDSSGNEMQAIFEEMDQSKAKLVASVDVINGSLADKKQLAKWDDQNKTIQKMTDDEKEPAIAKLNKEKMEYATALGLNKDVVTKAKKLPNDQKNKIGSAISDILLVSMQEKDTAKRAKDLVKTIVANPKSAVIYAGDLPKLKDVVSETPDMLSAQASLSKNLVAMANSANIKIQQPAPAKN